MKKKFLILSIILGLFLTSFSVSVLAADDDPVNMSADDYYECTDIQWGKDGMISSCATGITFEDIKLWRWAEYMGNRAPEELRTNIENNDGGSYRNSVMGKIGSSIAAIYTYKPADTRMYLADLGQRAGIVKPAYAQGIGFSGLSPLLGLWKAFRNVAYGFLILVMVLIGFMVLFRMKIDPRTVISVQNAIPRVIITLILITFSYAIAGLMIDLMYLLIFLFIIAVRSALTPEGFQTIVANYTGGSTINLLSAVFSTGTGAINDLSQLLGGVVLDGITTLVLAIAGGFFTAGWPILGSIWGVAGGAALGSYGQWSGTGSNPLVAVLIWLALIFVFIRILFVLINAYIQVIMSVIFGPLQLMFGAIPNTNAFSSWLRGLIANLATFPITMGIILMAQILSTIASTKDTNLWTPPGLSGNLVGSSVASGVAGVIGLGMLFTVPSIVNSVKEMLKTKAFIQAGAGTIISPLAAPVGTLWNLAYQTRIMGLWGREKKPQAPAPKLPEG